MDLYELASYRGIHDDYSRTMQADNLYKETDNIEQVDKLCKSFLLSDRAKKLFEQSKINKRFKDSTFENFRTETKMQIEGLKKAQEYVENIESHLESGTNLIFAGFNNVGTGKTHLANAIAKALMTTKGIPCKFINVVSMVAELKSSFSIREFVDVEVLIIDDLGKETGTKWVCEQMYAIINARYEEMKPTIITTENDITALKNNYDEKGKAIVSRICQDYILIKLAGDDCRFRKK